MRRPSLQHVVLPLAASLLLAAPVAATGERPGGERADRRTSERVHEQATRKHEANKRGKARACGNVARSTRKAASNDVRAAIKRACAELRASFLAAKAERDAAKHAIRTEFKSALQKAEEVCAAARESGDEQVCMTARAAFHETKESLHARREAVRRTFRKKVRAALATFHSTMRGIRRDNRSDSADPDSGDSGPEDADSVDTE